MVTEVDWTVEGLNEYIEEQSEALEATKREECTLSLVNQDTKMSNENDTILTALAKLKFIFGRFKSPEASGAYKVYEMSN